MSPYANSVDDESDNIGTSEPAASATSFRSAKDALGSGLLASATEFHSNSGSGFSVTSDSEPPVDSESMKPKLSKEGASGKDGSHNSGPSESSSNEPPSSSSRSEKRCSSGARRTS